jgi:hypothetical protein
MSETALLVLPHGGLFAVMRSEIDDEALHPADLLRLTSGDILLTYGNRSGPYRIEGKISRDEGRSWLDVQLAFSGHLYGYHVDEARSTDLGYPSSAPVGAPGSGQIVTMYYYNPAFDRSAHWWQGVGSSYYCLAGYRAIAVIWSEQELMSAVERCVSRP